MAGDWTEPIITEHDNAMKSLICLLFAVAAQLACTQGNESGQHYLNDFGKLITKAEHIEIVEHSSPLDLVDANTGIPSPSTEIIYKRIKLTDQQKNQFKSKIEALPPKTQNLFPSCIIVAHHRLEFYTAGMKIDSMEICFECGQVEWSGTKATPPLSLYSGLESFILSVGMQPKQDWASLASRH
ncbi:hypothetical protein [Chitinibacter sp. GC72]|uniref:hypothetical protein n=1 Tax=Chitinibacter sp. GC72 TaxID=1526917 RepID=UPI0012FC30B3|nr:hypothetical protein [Chitinibacter sp. GC72]